MRDIEDQVRDIIERYSALIRKVIQGQLFAGDDVDLEDVE